MGARDSGWIQLYSESGQEAYENAIMAVRMAEHEKVRLPVMVCLDGFITSHGMERVEIHDDAEVRDFIGEYKPHKPLLDIEDPVTYGPLDFYDYYYEHKRQQVEAMQNAMGVVKEITDEFNKQFGRSYGYFEEYRMDDAEAVIVVLNSTAGTTKVVVDRLRAEGMKVGLLKPRVFRPFPADEFMDALRGAKIVGVMDRAISFGSMNNGGPLWSEFMAAARLHGLEMPMLDYVYGLGGRDTMPGEIESIYHNLFKVLESGEIENPVTYVGVRGDEPITRYLEAKERA
jgi:pyruvate ferredoxin oxidoreductase alpha subunit